MWQTPRVTEPTEGRVQTSRFQLGLIAILALGLGYTLSSSQAIGYPAGAAVSSGTNPVVSAGGTVGWGQTADLFTAPSDQDVVITDIVLSGNSNSETCRAQMPVTIETESGALGHFSVGTPWHYSGSWVTSGGETNLVATLDSGLRLPAGQTATISVDSSGMFWSCGSTDPNRAKVHYAIGGYSAQP